jgi:hypothetical protein
MFTVKLNEKPGNSKFRWRTSRYEYIAVGSMTNSSLLYTAKMLWNGHMPVAATITETIPTCYEVMPNYSSSYVIDSLRAMLSELEKRFIDLGRIQQREVLHMRIWSNKPVTLRNVREHSWTVNDGVADG